MRKIGRYISSSGSIEIISFKIGLEIKQETWRNIHKKENWS